MRKKWKRAIAAASAAALAFTAFYFQPASVRASSVSELEQQQSQLESEKAAAEKEASALKAAKEQLQSQLGSMNSDLYDLSNQISDLEDDIASTQNDIDETQEQLAVQEKIADEQYQDMKLRIQFAYENSTGFSYLEAFLGADSFVDLLNRVSYVSELTTYDRNQLDDYEAVIDQIQESKTHLETQMASLEEKQTDLEEDETKLLDAISEKQSELASTSSSLNSVEEQNAAREEKLASLSDKIEAMEAYEEALEEQQAKEEAAKEAAAKSASSSKSSSSGSTKSSSSSNSTKSSSSSNSTKSSSSSGSTKSSSSSAGEAELFAALVYCEAGGESYEGQLAVASVVMNRVHSSSFPNTITGVIYQSGQFSPVSSGRLAVVLANGLATSSCRQAANAAMSGSTNGSWLYFRRANGHSGDVIGNQVFY